MLAIVWEFRVKAAGEWVGCYREVHDVFGFAYAEALFDQARQLRELFARATA